MPHLLFYRPVDSYQSLIVRLAGTEVGSQSCNFYRYDEPGSEIRRHNLLLYWQRMAERQPQLLLVGEAPGYRGCRVTGIPFTSSGILLSDPSPHGLFSPAAGFRVHDTADGYSREATATTLWQTLVKLDVLPLLWNAFPFHPHQPAIPASNRPPTMAELALGRESLVTLIDLFNIERVIAVGNKAAVVLERWKIPAMKVRHPGHGGKALFETGLRQCLSDAVKAPGPENTRE